MPFSVSPNVNVTNRNLTNLSTNVSDVIVGFVGRFDWGPTGENKVISSEAELYSAYGAPAASATGGMDWWIAANALSYGNALTVRRSISYANTASKAYAAGFTYSSATAAAFGGTTNSLQALHAGTLGNSLRVAIVGSKMGHDSWYRGPSASALGTTLGIWNPHNYGYIPTTTAFASDRGVTGDELHLAILNGRTETALGVADNILEVYTGLSRCTNAKAIDGSNIYYKDYINNNSNYIRIQDTGLFVDTDPTISDNTEDNSGVTFQNNWIDNTAGYQSGASFGFNGMVVGDSAGETLSTAQVAGGTGGATGNVAVTFLSGAAGATNWYTAGRSSDYTTAFGDPEQSDVDILLVGDPAGGLNRAVADIALDRKDCVAVCSPDGATTTTFHVANDSTPTISVGQAKTSRDAVDDNSYTVMDSGWKYMYDSRNDVGRWIPMCSDSAGILARTTNNKDPWFSPAGLNRGVLNSVIKLSLNPTRIQRDDLVASQINPVTTFPGEGAVLFGDRTLQTRPSPFDRVHIRRLMNVLEKQIATAAKLQLFEFNDNFTQRSFVNLVEPFLRSVKARNGIDSFSIVCDDTNNTQGVIDDGRFLADIFIKPLNSINIVALNFTAQSNTAAFTENIASNRVSSNEISGY